MTSTPLHIEATDPLAQKVRTLQTFLGEHFFHDSGLMWAMGRYKDQQVRPLNAADLEGMSILKTKAGTPMHDLYNMENSPYTSGLFLWSQVLRYQATKEEEALRYAAKAFRSLDLNFQMCEANGERGLLCKPYGFKFSRETSPDQQVSVLLGMWEYRKIADEATRRRIDEMIPAISDWWRTRDYKLVYFDHAGDWLYNDDARAQYGPVYVMMHRMAHLVSGREECRKEADRVQELVGTFRTRLNVAVEKLVTTGKTNWPENLHGYEYNPARRPFIQYEWEVQPAIWLAAAPVAWLIENEPADSPLRRLLQHALGTYYRHIRSQLTDDLLCPYWTQTDLETEKTYPLRRPRISTDVKDFLIGLDWSFFSYASGVCVGDAAARIIDTALLAHRYAPGFSPGALSLAKAMLAKLDDLRLLSFIDPDGKQLMPEDRWLGEVLSSETPAFTALSYWRARLWNIEL